MLPSKLKNFNLFNDAQSYLGVCSALTPPKIAVKGEAYRGAGGLGEVDYDLGLEKLEMEATYGGLVVGVMRQMGMVRVDGVQLRFVGAYQSDQTGGVTAAEMLVRGRHMEMDTGNVKAGDDTEWKVKSTLSYLKWTVAGTVEMEIDMLTGLYVVGGVDRTAEIREIIGATGATPSGGSGGLLGGVSGGVSIPGLGRIGVGGNGFGFTIDI